MVIMCHAYLELPQVQPLFVSIEETTPGHFSGAYSQLEWEPGLGERVQMLVMAPQMAATVLCSPVFVLFLFVFPVFCFSNTISFTRDELLNIRQNTPQNLLPDFDYSDALLDIIVGGAKVLFRLYRLRRWGKHAGALVKLRQRGLRTPLPSIHLTNLRSLPNKTD